MWSLGVPWLWRALKLPKKELQQNNEHEQPEPVKAVPHWAKAIIEHVPDDPPGMQIFRRPPLGPTVDEYGQRGLIATLVAVLEAGVLPLGAAKT